MNLVDVHCHLNHEQFKPDFEEVIRRAEATGVRAIVISGVNPEANREVLQLVGKHSLLKACLGIYPIDALGLSEGETGLPRHPGKIDLESEFKFFEENKDQIVGIGEIGMDFHWATKEETYTAQADNFRKIIQFAKKIKKTILIHSRDAERECLEILGQEITSHEIPVVLHCFSGRKSLIREAAAKGYYFSIPPNIVKSSSFQALALVVDIKQILTETDAPWLSPFPGKRNEPAFVSETIKKIAEIKKISPEEVAKQVWENYLKIFK